MFGRKKNKDEKRKKHKNSMSQADLSKLEEVGIRRGFFSKMYVSVHQACYVTPVCVVLCSIC